MRSEALSFLPLLVGVVAYSLFHHLALAQRRSLARRSSDPGQITTQQRDVTRLELIAAATAVCAVGLRAALGRELGVSLWLAAWLYASVFAAGIYWFYPDVTGPVRSDSPWAWGQLPYGLSELSDGTWGCMATVFAVAATVIALGMVGALIAVP